MGFRIEREVTSRLPPLQGRDAWHHFFGLRSRSLYPLQCLNYLSPCNNGDYRPYGLDSQKTLRCKKGWRERDNTAERTVTL